MFAFDFQLFYSGFDCRFPFVPRYFFSFYGSLIVFCLSVLCSVFFSDLEPTGDSFAC